MKPYYLAIPAAVELYLLIRRGWRTTFSDPIPWAIVAGRRVRISCSMYTIFAEFGRFVHAAGARILRADRRRRLARRC